MSKDIETFMCMIQYTEYMINLLLHSGNVEKYKEEIYIISNFERYKNIKEIVLLNNKHINNSIKELLSNETKIKMLIEDTNIKIQELYEIKQYL